MACICINAGQKHICRYHEYIASAILEVGIPVWLLNVSFCLYYVRYLRIFFISIRVTYTCTLIDDA